MARSRACWLLAVVLVVPSAAAGDCGECVTAGDCVPSFSRCVTTGCTPDHCCVDVPVDCDDHLACTIDSCSETLGCRHVDACDDGNPCNGAETCLAFGTDHLCLEGVPLDCDDGDACTVDQCRPSGCAHDPLDCDDHDPCTADACDHATGCVHVPIAGCCTNDATCQTDRCMQGATCVGGSCRGGVRVDCDDADACTTDACDPERGCTHTPIDCNDGDVCTRDACEPTAGCTHAAVAGCCNDDAHCRTDACFVGRTCVSNSCVGGSPVRCDDGDPCTNDRCDAQLGCTADPVTGPAAALCVCDMPTPSPCSGVQIPHAVAHALTRSCTVIRRATSPGRPERQRKLAGRAARDFAKGETLTAHPATKGTLGRTCADALAALFGNGNRRALVFRDTR